jgi:hypothetical protein
VDNRPCIDRLSEGVLRARNESGRKRQRIKSIAPLSVVRSLTVFFLAPAFGLCAAGPHPLRAEFNRAWQLAGEARPDEAIPLLKQIIAKDKTFIDAYTTLVEAYRQKKELGEGEKYFRSLLGTAGNGLAFYGLARVSHLRGQHEAAVEYYTTCIRHSPDACLCHEKLVRELEEAHPGALSSGSLSKRISLSEPGSCSYAANDSSNWFESTALNTDSFSNGTPTSLFDFPILGPGATVTEPFDPVNGIGLFELLWDPSAPVGFINSGNFVLSGQWFDGDPSNGGNFIVNAPDMALAYTATVSVPSTVPEPSGFGLLSWAIAMMMGFRIARRVLRHSRPRQQYLSQSR